MFLQVSIAVNRFKIKVSKSYLALSKTTTLSFKIILKNEYATSNQLVLLTIQETEPDEESGGVVGQEKEQEKEMGYKEE